MLPRFPLRLAPFALVSLFAATASVAAPRLDREKLLQYRATDGLVQPVRSPAEWALRRAEIRAGAESVMGPLPGAAKRASVALAFAGVETS